MTTPIGITIGLDGVQQTEAGLRRVVGGVDAVGISAKQTAAALRGVPAQFTDIITSLQGGQAPLTVFLQQGGQLKDMFGGAGNAARALGGYVVGLVNPFTVAAAAGVALAVAYNQGSKEADAYTKSIALTGNAAGVTTAQLQGMAGRVSDVVGTQAKASEVLAQLVGTGNVAKAALEQQAATSIRLERNVGIAVKDTVKEFSELGKEPVEAAKKLNERYNYLTAAVYEQIKALKDQGKTQEAVALSQATYEKAMSTVADTLEGKLGYLERAWRAVGDGAAFAWDKMLNVGRGGAAADATAQVRDRLTRQQQELADKRAINPNADTSGMEKGIEVLKQRLGVMESDERMLRRGADAQAQRTKAEKDGIAAAEALQKVQGKGLTQQQQMNKALEEYRRQVADLRAVNPNSERLTPNAIAQGERAIREQYKPKGGSGAASGGENEVAALRAQADAAEKYLEQLRATGAEVEKLTSGEQRAAKIREELKTSITGTARAQKELALVEAERLGAAERATVTQKTLIKSIEESEAAYRKVLDAITKTGDAYGTQADQQEAANASFGRSKTAIEDAALAQQKLYLANEKAAGPWDPARIKAMEYAIEQQERYVDALRGGDGKAINAQTDELLRSAQALAAVYADEAQLAGLSAVERGKTVALRQVELKYAKELAAIDRSSAKDDEKQRARDTALQAKMIEGQAAVSKVVEEDWARTSKTIGDTLSDYIMGGGKNAAQYLQRLFSTLVLQPTVQYAASAFMGALGMGPAAGGGSGGGGIMGLLNGASSAKNAYSLYQGGLSGFTAPGSMYYNFATSGVGQGLGLSNAAPIMGNNISAFAPAGTQLTGAGSMSGLAGAGAFAAVAAVVLNALGAFKSERKNGGGLMGTLGGGPLSAWEEWREGGTLFSGPSFNTFSPTAELDSQRAKLASLRESGQGNTQQAATLQTIIDNLEEQYGGLAEATAAQSKVIQTAFDAMRKSAGDMADTLGLSSEAARNFTTALGGEKGLALDGLKPEEQQAKLAEALATANNEIAQQLIGTWETTTSEITRIVSENLGSAGEDASIVYSELSNSITKTRYVQSEYAKEGEKAIDTLTRLSTSMGVVNETADALGIGMADASLAAAAAASNIVDAFGGLEAFTQTLGTYFSNFYSETEQKAATARQVARALGDAGFEVDPATLEGATRTGIRAFVESVGEQFGYESKQYVAAVQQANVLASITEALPATVQAIDTAAQTAQQAAQDAARAWQDITDALLGNRSSAEIDLLRAQGKQEEALAAERARAIVGYDAYQVSLYDGTQAIFRQIEAIDKATEARTREAESVANLFSAADSAASGFLSGADLQAFQARRQSDQLKGLGFDVSASDVQNASIEQVKSITLAILAMGDVSADTKTSIIGLAGSIIDTKEAAQQTALQGTDAAFQALQRSVAARRELLTESASELKSVFELLKSNVKDLYGEVDGAAQAQAAKARQFISQALGAARTTGYLPDSKELQNAINSARGGLDAKVYASQAEADYERLVFANELRDLQDISGDQLTEAEKQLRALEAISTNAQTQIDALRGIDQGVKSLGTAISELGVAILAAVGTGIKPTGGTITAPSSRVEYGNSAVVAASGYVQSAVASGDLMGIYQGAKANGLNSADAAYLLQLSGFDVSKEDVLAWVKSQGLPAFAGGGFHSGGLRVVGEHGLEIEATGPSRIWNQQQIAAAMGGSNADLVAEVRLLRLEVAELRFAGDQTAANTGRSAEVLTSVKNGNSLVTAAAPTF